MLSAPLIKPAISVRIFVVAFAPPRVAMRNRSVSNIASPHRASGGGEIRRLLSNDF